ncbi:MULTISPECIES: helix-turn-helix transcriptional regulator [unclassified Novosphingobium]|jgi:DNA-binding transcriptional ArsR family regulator|uniref:ArsR/SmtB family transcription factor n=1 Tax=unclassified Novosphingobium TaxID=2644732 RepID=UPI00061BC6FD|nr:MULTISPECIES: metalloregulator ArsR/SmtB family transcription factor [unclassified Novosphingobium]MBF5090837.1 helix-turn-helix transcriptional regulator [Novosphingobium sp. NBM11]RQW43220.1 transcriptional regulator [Novosphingobium sp. LASN5T]GAO54836.1 transcriptional regulator of arsR family [Novosphingobium sp. MD-1]
MKPADLSDLKANANRMAQRLKIMSHPERLLMLCRMDEGEVSVNELVALTGLSQSAVSQHLAMLREEGVVAIRGEAQTRFYSLKDPVVRAIIHALCIICDQQGDSGRDAGQAAA